MSEKNEVSRRTYLKYVGVGAAAAAAAGAGLYYFTRPAEPTPPPTKPTNLDILLWTYKPEIFEELATEFEEDTGIKAEGHFLPYEGYTAGVQTKIFGGAYYDALYVEQEQKLKWYRAGWLRKLSDFPEAEKIQSEFLPAHRPQYETPEGELLCLPYAAGPLWTVQYNRRIMDKWGWELPKTRWELHDLCLQAKEKGLRAPYTGYWSYQMGIFMIALWATERGLKLFDDETHEPLFEDDPEFLDILRWIRAMFKDGCTSPSIMTDNYDQVVMTMANGDAFIGDMHSYWLAGIFNSGAKEAKNCTYADQPFYGKKTYMCSLQQGMMSQTKSPEWTWEWMKLWGWKDKNGVYRYARHFSKSGSISPYKLYWEDPVVIENHNRYCDFDLLKKWVMEYADSAPYTYNIVWYGEWGWYAHDILQKVALGEIDFQKAATRLADKGRALEEESKI